MANKEKRFETITRRELHGVLLWTMKQGLITLSMILG